VPVSMDWDNPERTIIRVTFEGVWGADDIYRMINKGVSMLETVDHPVDSIFDFTNSTFSPKNLLSTAEKMENELKTNHRLAILVKANIYIKSLLKVARVFAPQALANLHFVGTIDQAYAIISEQTDHVLS
jgi:hypothetical protein